MDLYKKIDTPVFADNTQLNARLIDLRTFLANVVVSHDPTVYQEKVVDDELADSAALLPWLMGQDKFLKLRSAIGRAPFFAKARAGVTSSSKLERFYPTSAQQLLHRFEVEEILAAPIRDRKCAGRIHSGRNEAATPGLQITHVDAATALRIGYTISVVNCHTEFRRLTQAIVKLVPIPAELSFHAARVGAYTAPPKYAVGDALLIQINGVQRVRVWSPGWPLWRPRSDQLRAPFFYDAHPEANVTEHVLTAGDVLYLPRGTPYAGVAIPDAVATWTLDLGAAAQRVPPNFEELSDVDSAPAVQTASLHGLAEFRDDFATLEAQVHCYLSTSPQRHPALHIAAQGVMDAEEYAGHYRQLAVGYLSESSTQPWWSGEIATLMEDVARLYPVVNSTWASPVMVLSSGNGALVPWISNAPPQAWNEALYPRALDTARRGVGIIAALNAGLKACNGVLQAWERGETLMARDTLQKLKAPMTSP